MIELRIDGCVIPVDEIRPCMNCGSQLTDTHCMKFQTKHGYGFVCDDCYEAIGWLQSDEPELDVWGWNPIRYVPESASDTLARKILAVHKEREDES